MVMMIDDVCFEQRSKLECLQIRKNEKSKPLKIAFDLIACDKICNATILLSVASNHYTFKNFNCRKITTAVIELRAFCPDVNLNILLFKGT